VSGLEPVVPDRLAARPGCKDQGFPACHALAVPVHIAPTLTPADHCSCCCLCCSCCCDCRTCNECINSWQEFVSSQALVTNAAAVAEAFRVQCAAMNMSAGACRSVGSMVGSSLNGNGGKRAGQLCMWLGKCDPATLGLVMPASLVAASNAPATTAAPQCVITISNSSLMGLPDLCTQQGVAFGAPVPGIAATSATPAGRCRTGGDCPQGTVCSREPSDVASVCSCDRGRDTCSKLGTCMPTPCQRCQNTLTALQPYITSLSVDGAPTAPDAVATAFAATCVAPPLSQSPAKCQAVSAQIRNSLNGNLGRRAGEDIVVEPIH
jgi:hypothetical protein